MEECDSRVMASSNMIASRKHDKAAAGIVRSLLHISPVLFLWYSHMVVHFKQKKSDLGPNAEWFNSTKRIFICERRTGRFTGYSSPVLGKNEVQIST